MLIFVVCFNFGVVLLFCFVIYKDLENGDMVIFCDLLMSIGNYFVLIYKDGKRGLWSL